MMTTKSAYIFEDSAIEVRVVADHIVAAIGWLVDDMGADRAKDFRHTATERVDGDEENWAE